MQQVHLSLFIGLRKIACRFLLAGLPCYALFAATAIANDEPADSQQNNAPRLQTDPNAYQQILVERLPQDTVWLNEANNPFLCLHKSSLKSSAKGNILLLTNPGTRIASSRRYATIRTSLADFGWNTLVVPIPALPRQAPPQRMSNTGDNADESATSKSGKQTVQEQLDQWRQTSQTRISSAMDYAGKQAGNKLIIIAQGQSADLALQLVSNELASKVGALAIIDHASINATTSMVPEQIASQATELKAASSKAPTLSLPVLEISTAPKPSVSRTRSSHQQGRPQYSFGNYTTVNLTGSRHPMLQGENTLSKRIRGWLSHVAG
jgi:hypothetical protein